LNAEGAADAGGAAYAPLEPPYAPVSYAPNVEVGAGSDSYALPPAGTLPAGEGAAGCSKGLRKSSLPLAPPRAPGSAYGFAAPFSSNGLSAIVTCRATPRRPLAAVHERLEKIKPRRRATASVGVRAETPWLSRGLRSRRRVYEDGRVGGVDRVARASTKVWRLALEIVRNARACVPTEKVYTYNLPRASFGPTNRDFERTLSGRQLVFPVDDADGFQIEPSACRRSPHAPSATMAEVNVEVRVSAFP
jgi:hypothetical protein